MPALPTAKGNLGAQLRTTLAPTGARRHTPFGEEVEFGDREPVVGTGPPSRVDPLGLPKEKHLLFRFRWSLTDNPGALTKFLHAVDWSDLEQRRHAIELMRHWSPMDIDDALELLSKDFNGIAEIVLDTLGCVEARKTDPVERRVFFLCFGKGFP